MAENKLKRLNSVQLTGRINVKRRNEQNDSLFVVLSVSTPKSAIASRNPDEGWNRDYPAMTFTGDLAKEIDEKYEVGDRLSVIGKMDTRQRMAYEGNRTYKEVWEPFILPEVALPAAQRLDANVVAFCGEVIRVYRNPDQGKKFYMITLRLPGVEDRDARATFTYFDPRMELEPQVGEIVYAGGAIQTKRENVDVDGRERTRFIMSVVSRNVIMQRDKTERPAVENVPQQEEDDDIAI